MTDLKDEGASSPLRIQLVFGPTGCTSGGLSIDVSSIANHLTARGHSVSVLTTAAQGNQRRRRRARQPTGSSASLQPVQDGGECYVSFSKAVQVYRLATLPLGNLAVQVSLTTGALEITRRERPDIVHVFSLAPNYLHSAAVIAARTYRLPVVRSPMMHPIRATTWQGRGLVGVGMRCFDATMPRVAARADLVVAATSEEERFFRSLGARRVVTAPPGVDAADVVTGGDVVAFRRRVGLDEAAPVVIAVSARSEPRKGLDLLRGVAAELDRALPEARILVVGLENDTVLGRNIVYTGRLDKHYLAQAYAAADVAFVPSRYEAFSRVVIEAWQQSCPVVVTSGVGLASEVRATAGLVVPVDDRAGATNALLELLTTRVSAARLGERGRELVRERYEWPRIVDTLETAYRELRSGHSGRGRYRRS